MYYIPIFSNNVFYSLKSPYFYAIYSDHTHLLIPPSNSIQCLLLYLPQISCFVFIIVINNPESN